MKSFKRLLRIFLGIPITILSFFFLGKVFFDNKEILLLSIKELNVPLFLNGIFFFALFFLSKSLLWLLILKKRGHIPPFRSTLLKYSLSELKRYIPGSIFAVFGRLKSLDESISHKETLKSIVIEAVLLSTSAMLLSIPALYYKFPQLTLIFLLATILSTSFFVKKIKKTIFKYIDIFFMFCASWTFYGIGCLLVTISFNSTDPNALLQILSFYILSWLAGYLFFITPMGLGIREIVITSMLSIFMNPAFAATIAVLARVAMTLGEMLALAFIYVFASLKRNSKILQLNPYHVIVCIVAFLYFSLFTILSIQKHNSLLSGRFDLGNMSQTVWNTSNGKFFTLTNPDGIEIVSRLAIHSDFILVLFAPFYWIWPDPKVLLIFQSLFLSIGGIFVFLIAKHVLKSDKLSLILSISYFFNFWLHEQNLFDFHPVTLATPLLLASIYFLIKKDYTFFTISLLLSVLTKENIFLIASFFGLYFFMIERRRKIGIALFVLPVLIFLFLSFYAIPLARQQAHFVLQNYSYLGNSMTEVVKNIIFNPQIFINQIFNDSTINYLYYHFLPLGFLSLLSPFFLLFTLPEFAIYLLSENFEYRSYEYHFGAAILPFLYVAAINSLKYLQIKSKYIFNEKFFIYYLLFFSLFSMYLYSPLPGMRNADSKIFEENDSQRILEYLTIIPPEASVASSNNIAAHMSHRDMIYVIPYGMEIADFVIFYNEKKDLISKLDTSKYKLLVKYNNFLVYEKMDQSFLRL